MENKEIGTLENSKLDPYYTCIHSDTPVCAQCIDYDRAQEPGGPGSYAEAERMPNFSERQRAYEQEQRKGMLMFVLRDAEGKDYSNRGITSRVTRVVVTGTWFDGTPIPEIFDPTPDAPEMKIGSHLPQTGYFHAYPVDGKDPEKTGWTFGGNYIHSSDSRCPHFPIPVHDRQDTWEDYDRLTV